MANSAAPKPAIAPIHIHVQGKAFVEETIDWLTANSVRIAIAVGVAIALTLLFMGIRKLASKLARPGEETRDLRSIVGRVAQKTSLWFIILLAAKLVDNYAETPPLLDKTIGFLFTIGATFQGAIWARELVLGFVEHRASGADQDHSALDSALGIIRFFVTFTLFSIALVLVLGNIGVNVTGLVAGLGVGGIAIGLAAQGIFKDLFAALAIIFDHPFRRGDSITWNGISGSVEAIGLKTTRLRALTGELVVVGNAHMLEKELYNLARLDRRRMTLAIGVTYATPADVCDRIPALLQEITESVDKCVVVRVGMIGFGDSSLDFQLQFDIKSSNYNEVFEARSKVALAILRRFNDDGIDFAFPTQTTITAGPDGKAVMPYPNIRLIGDPPDAPPDGPPPTRPADGANEVAP